jgi:hypothetical protein
MFVPERIRSKKHPLPYVSPMDAEMLPSRLKWLADRDPAGTVARNHWPTHKKQCKLRAAELRDEELFKDPPLKEDCPLLPTNACRIDLLCLTSTRDYILRTN